MESRRKTEGFTEIRKRFVQRANGHAQNAIARWGKGCVEQWLNLAFWYGWQARYGYDYRRKKRAMKGR